MSHDHGPASTGTCSTGPVRSVPAPATAEPRPPLTISDHAAVKLKEIMGRDGKDPAVTGLRLGVQGGGCSGLSYVMDFDVEKPGDRVFEKDGIKVFIDPRSVLHISGSILEYNEGLMGSGFAIKNPNVKSSCGCGQSFST